MVMFEDGPGMQIPDYTYDMVHLSWGGYKTLQRVVGQIRSQCVLGKKDRARSRTLTLADAPRPLKEIKQHPNTHIHVLYAIPWPNSRAACKANDEASHRLSYTWDSSTILSPALNTLSALEMSYFSALKMSYLGTA